LENPKVWALKEERGMYGTSVNRGRSGRKRAKRKEASGMENIIEWEGGVEKAQMKAVRRMSMARPGL